MARKKKDRRGKVNLDEEVVTHCNGRWKEGVQWLRLYASTAGGAGSVPGQGTKILHAAQRGQKKDRRGKVNLDEEVVTHCNGRWKEGCALTPLHFRGHHRFISDQYIFLKKASQSID